LLVFAPFNVPSPNRIFIVDELSDQSQ
jgi:hypothetical protein